MQIERVISVDDELVAAFAQLMPQLSSTAATATRVALEQMIASGGTSLVVARDPHVVATATLTVYRIPTGVNARIDDVVVDSAARGRGIGEALTRELIGIARDAGARAVSLTSRPDREAANRLYQRLGFVRVETNVYRFPL